MAKRISKTPRKPMARLRKEIRTLGTDMSARNKNAGKLPKRKKK